MSRRLLRLTAACSFLAGAFLTVPAVPAADDAAAPIRVVATIPVLKDLAEQVGGGRVSVVSLLSGLESEHTYAPKPADVLAIRKARVLLQVGVGLEVWAGSLIKNAGNPNLMVVTTSRGIVLLREHETPGERSSSDEHEGNPHVWLDPENAKIMLRHITEAFSSVDPAHAAEYRESQAAYLNRLDRLEADLLGAVRGVPQPAIIVHHPAWPYFARRFGFRIAGSIISQPGSEPSAQHLHELITLIRAQHIRVIVSEPQMNRKIPEMIAKESGGRVVVLTPLPGGLPGTETYLDLLRYNVMQLVQALRAP
jgi:zinc/manganese transport system substrate-binding protein/zinc transport system substrate-binding protein/manganese/iron transport system substrate-binding protein